MIALGYILKKIQEVMFFKGKIENWVVILDMSRLSILGIPISVYFP